MAVVGAAAAAPVTEWSATAKELEGMAVAASAAEDVAAAAEGWRQGQWREKLGEEMDLGCC